MFEIHNDALCFLNLWRKLVETEEDLYRNHKWFSPNNVLQSWFGKNITPRQIREICINTENDGYRLYWRQILPDPGSRPMVHRLMLRSIVSNRLGIPLEEVNLYAIDLAHDLAFPGIRPLLDKDGSQKYPLRKHRKTKGSPELLLATLFPDILDNL